MSTLKREDVDVTSGWSGPTATGFYAFVGSVAIAWVVFVETAGDGFAWLMSSAGLTAVGLGAGLWLTTRTRWRGRAVVAGLVAAAIIEYGIALIVSLTPTG